MPACGDETAAFLERKMHQAEIDRVNRETARLKAALELAAEQVQDEKEAPVSSGNAVADTKRTRQELDRVLQNLRLRCQATSRISRERNLAITKIQEAIMWLGMDLKDLNEPNPYPESYNPSSPKIEPTADGLKL
jgi:hypothetical protein